MYKQEMNILVVSLSFKTYLNILNTVWFVELSRMKINYFKRQELSSTLNNS